jgi:hypothetical protein
MRIEYRCSDGSRTLARWPSIALLHWLGRSRPRPVIENPQPFTPYVVRAPIPSDTHPLFLTLVCAECESRWNRRPPLDLVAPVPTPQQPRDDSFHFPPGGQAYQDRCLVFLRFLREAGDIVDLRIEDDREETAEDAKRMLGLE